MSNKKMSINEWLNKGDISTIENVITAKPGETLIFRFRGNASENEALLLKEKLGNLFKDNHVVVIENGTKVSKGETL